MKTILAFGDSLTWGSRPEDGQRHPRSHRWPEVLEAALSGKTEVVTDAVRGRTTAFDDHMADANRNGAQTLATALYAHAPVDLVIIMLGANDVKTHTAGTALAAMQGMRRLIHIVHNHVPGVLVAQKPEVLIIAPPPLCLTSNPEFAAMFNSRIEESKMLASMYRDLADEMGVAFFDAATVAKTSPLDAVHIDAEGTRAIGLALVPIVTMMLGL
jgi:lysophospholipase L1-like esterase